MSTTASALRYQLVPDWEQLPDGMHHEDVVGVSVDSRDRLFVFSRRESRVAIYEPDGSFVVAWGDGFFTPRTHGITVAPDDTVYCVDEGRHVIYHFRADGTLLNTIGTPDTPSVTGYDGAALDSIARGGLPFNRPTNLAIAPNGDLYVSDGYGNARVHHFTPDGELVRSWGEPGTGPGQFNLPHGIAVAADGRILVADRENDRVQVFSADGTYLEEWTDIQRPTNIALDAENRIYISELGRDPGDVSYRLGEITDDRPGRFSVFSPERELLARVGGPDRTVPGNFIAAHDICVDSRGDIYVGEVTWTFAVSRGRAPEGSHTLQKFKLLD